MDIKQKEVIANKLAKAFEEYTFLPLSGNEIRNFVFTPEEKDTISKGGGLIVSCYTPNGNFLMLIGELKGDFFIGAQEYENEKGKEAVDLLLSRWKEFSNK